MGDKTMHTLKEFKGSMIGETPFTHLDERPWQYLYTFGKYSRVPIRFVIGQLSDLQSVWFDSRFTSL